MPKEYIVREDDYPLATGQTIVGEVVRCKDCKHREVQVDGVFHYEMCGMRNEIINLNGFCHMGERKEDAKTN